jgi:hypothetical protein
MHAPLVGPYFLGRHKALAGRGVFSRRHEKFARTAQAAYEVPDPATRLLTWVRPRWIPLDQHARAYQRRNQRSGRCA